ncbi:MAG: hypothetical protein RQ751_13720 [Longimicrobiales bacterium]|nr:hypothetical protein [Longimicrobiales bacterium]
MGFRTNPDRILDNIDRSRNRDDDGLRGSDRQASGRELDTSVPDGDATTPERAKRVFAAVERAYVKCAQSAVLGPLAQRFQAVGDIAAHQARGDVSVAVRYLDHERPEDFGMAPFEIGPDDLVEARKETRTTRPDVNAMRVLRRELRAGVLAAYKKLEPRVRDAIRERADLGHVEIQVTVDLRAVE